MRTLTVTVRGGGLAPENGRTIYYRFLPRNTNAVTSARRGE